MSEPIDELLRQVCYNAARNTQWRARDAQSTSLDAVTPAARRYYEIAKRRALKCDAELVMKAVRFLGEAFAIPPAVNNDSWLEEGLTIVLYLFEPWDAVEGDTRAFLTDLRDALNRALSSRPTSGY